MSMYMKDFQQTKKYEIQKLRAINSIIIYFIFTLYVCYPNVLVTLYTLEIAFSFLI